ncbi:MAG TPA: DUF2341 domain-containing protein, partial [Thermococcus sp.]|nr:DUF2341 domain-containing protein [Thermococcus sp.]
MKMSKLKKWLVCLLLFLLLFSIGFSYPQQIREVITSVGEGWLSGWQYRKSHEIQGSTAGAVTDYQVKIIVYYGSGSSSGEVVYLNGKCRSDFGDIRFTTGNGETLLSYWIEEKVDADHAVFWVKVPNIPANPGKTTIYIYYGNPYASSQSDGDDTFLLFDHFETFNSSKWTTPGSGTYSGYSVSNSILDLYSGLY